MTNLGLVGEMTWVRLRPALNRSEEVTNAKGQLSPAAAGQSVTRYTRHESLLPKVRVTNSLPEVLAIYQGAGGNGYEPTILWRG